MNARKAKWMSFLSKYDFKIKYIKGKENKVEYALSCHANLLFASNSYGYDLENHILSAENSDREYQILKERTAKMNKIK